MSAFWERYRVLSWAYQILCIIHIFYSTCTSSGSKHWGACTYGYCGLTIA